MTAKPVDAVFFWRATGVSNFKAVYGRNPSGTTYTKDFFQPRGDLVQALCDALGVPLGTQVNVEWRWPGASDPHGKLHQAADFESSNHRMNLRWATDSAPAPWRLHPNPTASTTELLKGQPGLSDEPRANAQLTALENSGEEPWFVAVHLAGEGPVLHARTFLASPAPDRAFASITNLPPEVQQAISQLGSSKPGGFVTFKEGYMPNDNPVVAEVLKAFEKNRNVLLVGPPGTGKTYAMNEIRKAFSDPSSVTFDPDVLHGAFGNVSAPVETSVRSVVFHPAYSYEDFVMGLLPEPLPDGGGVGVAPKVGPLLELAHFASAPDRKALLVADEFNRGAAASIFGDTLALLDTDKRATPGDPDSGEYIETPFAHLGPTTRDGDELADRTTLPDSLYILAAMNSADRSVAPLDAALRRRFAIIHVGPDIEALYEHLDVPEDDSSRDQIQRTKAIAPRVLDAVNSRIESILGRDFLLGQSVFWGVGGDTEEEVLASIAEAWDNNVIGTLTLTFTDNDAALAVALNLDPNSEAPVPIAAAAKWHQPDERFSSVAAPRLRLVQLQHLPHDILRPTLAGMVDASTPGADADD